MQRARLSEPMQGSVAATQFAPRVLRASFVVGRRQTGVVQRRKPQITQEDARAGRGQRHCSSGTDAVVGSSDESDVTVK